MDYLLRSKSGLLVTRLRREKVLVVDPVDVAGLRIVVMLIVVSCCQGSYDAGSGTD